MERAIITFKLVGPARSSEIADGIGISHECTNKE